MTPNKAFARFYDKGFDSAQGAYTTPLASLSVRQFVTIARFLV